MSAEPSNPLSVPLDSMLLEFVQAQASAAGYSSPADYVEQLVRSAHRLHVDQQLEAALVEGLESGPALPMTPDDWVRLRSRAEKGGECRDAAPCSRAFFVVPPQLPTSTKSSTTSQPQAFMRH